VRTYSLLGFKVLCYIRVSKNEFANYYVIIQIVNNLVYLIIDS